MRKETIMPVILIHPTLCWRKKQQACCPLYQCLGNSIRTIREIPVYSCTPTPQDYASSFKCTYLKWWRKTLECRKEKRNNGRDSMCFCEPTMGREHKGSCLLGIRSSHYREQVRTSLRLSSPAHYSVWRLDHHQRMRQVWLQWRWTEKEVFRLVTSRLYKNAPPLILSIQKWQ